MNVKISQADKVSDIAEKRFSEKTKKYLVHRYGEFKDEELFRYLDEILFKIESNEESPSRQKLEWVILDSAIPGHLAGPGQQIFITVGRLHEVVRELDLALLIAHSLAHLDVEHSFKFLEKKLGITYLSNFRNPYSEFQSLPERIMLRKGMKVFESVLLDGYDQEMETEADQVAEKKLMGLSWGKLDFFLSLPIPGRPERGEVFGNHYFNDHFGFRVSLPPGWITDNKKTRHEIPARLLLSFSTTTRRGLIRGEIVLIPQSSEVSSKSILKNLKDKMEWRIVGQEKWGPSEVHIYRTKIPKAGWLRYAVNIQNKDKRFFVSTLVAPERLWNQWTSTFSDVLSSWSWQ